jgi:predicted unusual protein kinase regulating ubiquinone biosynthesis (AarF/ABC1/UbiB family)
MPKCTGTAVARLLPSDMRRKNKSNEQLQKQRRREIHDVVRRHGFGSRPAGQLEDAPDYMARMRALLLDLGPVCAAFGIYLSSRPDLFSLIDCVELAQIPNHGDPLPQETVREIVGDELTGHSDDPTAQSRFVKFEPVPFETRMLFQLHNGQLENGDLVVVKIVHPRSDLQQEPRLLPSIARVVAPRMVDPRKFPQVIAQFQSATAENLNCMNTADRLETLTHDCRDHQSICVPKVYHELCTKQILVTERLDGIRLDRFLEQRQAKLPDTDRSPFTSGIVDDELARLLCDAWLRQTFEGSLIPIEIRPENILIRSPTEIAILDGSFASFPSASRRNLLDYFIAAATDDPSTALKSLLSELDATRSTSSDSNLDREFRQVVAFRDGGWEDGGLANCLSDTLFAQWRLLARNGFEPLRHLTYLYRGTFHITSIARQVSPQRDSLLEGVKDLRLTKLLNDIGTMMEPSYWGGQADRLASLMILGPQHLDDALRTIADEEEASGETGRTSNHPLNPTMVLSMVLLSLILFRDQLTASLTPAMAEMITAVAFIVIAGLMLRVLSAGE